MDRRDLGAFLRSHRERLAPQDVGLPAGSRRRTPGLRREEVAVLAHISTEYHVRLEQGRAPRPSGKVLAGIAAAPSSLRRGPGRRCSGSPTGTSSAAPWCGSCGLSWPATPRTRR